MKNILVALACWMSLFAAPGPLPAAPITTLLQRGTEWVATGKVTQKVPVDFPTAQSASYRPNIAVLDLAYKKGLNPLSVRPGGATGGRGGVAGSSMAQTPTPEEGKTLFLRTCSGCHETDVATSQKLTRKQWEAIVSQMIDMGAPASDAEYAKIVEYLATNYGPEPAKAKVNVNTTNTKELTGKD